MNQLLNLFKILSSLSIVSVVFCSQSAAKISAFEGFTKTLGVDDHCVQWYTEQTIIFRPGRIGVRGVNCHIAAKFIKVDEEQFSLSITIPIAQFTSLDQKRDARVFKALHGDIQPEIGFNTDPLNRKQWQELQEKGGKLVGKLLLGKKLYNLTFSVNILTLNNKKIYTGSWSGALTSIDVEPPTSWLGFYIRVRDYVKLSFHLNLEQIEGFMRVKN